MLNRCIQVAEPPFVGVKMWTYAFNAKDRQDRYDQRFLGKDRRIEFKDENPLVTTRIFRTMNRTNDWLREFTKDMSEAELTAWLDRTVIVEFTEQGLLYQIRFTRRPRRAPRRKPIAEMEKTDAIGSSDPELA